MATICDQVTFTSLLKEVEDEIIQKIVEVKGSGDSDNWIVTFHSAFDPYRATKQDQKRARASSQLGTYVVIKAKLQNRSTSAIEFAHAKIFTPLDDSGSYVMELQRDKSEGDKIEDF